MSTYLSRNTLFLLAALLVLALGLRMYRIGTYSIYFDEQATLLVSQGVAIEGANQREVFSKPYFTPAEFWRTKTVADYVEANTRSDIGNSLTYYIIVWLWTKLFGLSDTALRMPSAIFGTLMVGLIFLFVRRRLRNTRTGLESGPATSFLSSIPTIDKLALASVAIATIEPFFVAYGHIARNYSVTFFLTLLSTHLFMIIMDRVEFGHKTATPALAWLYVGYGLSFIAAILSHYLAVTVFICHGLYAVLYLRNSRAWVWLSLTAVVSLVLIVPWFIWGGGEYTFPTLEYQKNFYRNLALTNPLHNGFGIILPATFPNIAKQALPVFSDLFIVTNGLANVVTGLRNSIPALLLGLLATVVMHRYWLVTSPPRWVYGAVPVILLAGLPFYTVLPLRLLVLSIAIPFLYLIYRYVADQTDSNQKKLVALLLILTFVPTLFLLFMAWRSGHTFGITQRYSGFSFPYVCILVVMGMYQLTNTRWWFSLPIVAVLLIQATHIITLLGDIYGDRSLKYSYFAEPRIPNPYRASALQLEKLYEPGDTILIPNKKRMIYSEEIDKTYSNVSLFEAQLLNIYLPKDAHYVQHVDPDEPNRIVLVKGRSGKKITIFDFKGTTYRYGG